MRFVEDAERQQEQARLRKGVLCQRVFGVSLLQFHLARGAVARQRMLQLELGEEAHAIRKLVAEEQDEAVEVDLVAVAGVRLRVVVMQLAVTANGRLLRAGVRGRERLDVVPGCLDADFGLLDPFVRGRHGGPSLAQFEAQLVDLGLLPLHDLPQLFDRGGCLLRLACRRGQQQRRGQRNGPANVHDCLDPCVRCFE